jgi:hypothetical protein
LFIVTALVAVGCLAISWAVRHWTVVDETDLDDGLLLLREYADGRLTVTEYDEAGNPTTREMKRERDRWTVKMPSGNTIRHREHPQHVQETTATRSSPDAAPDQAAPPDR